MFEIEEGSFSSSSWSRVHEITIYLECKDRCEGESVTVDWLILGHDLAL